MAIIYLLASLVVLARVCVPLSETDLGGWPARLTFFILWIIALFIFGGKSLDEFLRKLKSQRWEIVCYVCWIFVLAFYRVAQDGEDLLTKFLMNTYIGAFPFYILGTYFSVDENRGRVMAIAVTTVVGASCLFAIPVVWRDPSLVRMGAIISTSQTRSLGIGSYGDLTGFAIALPFFFTLSMQNKIFFRAIGLAGFLATFAFLSIATLSGVILLSGMAICGIIFFYLFLGGLHFRRMLFGFGLVCSLTLAAIFVFPNIYERARIGRFYDKLAKTFTSLTEIFSGEERDPTSRYALMLESIEVFSNQPIFGAGLDAGGDKDLRGGHSSWIDALALFGILGCIPYACFHLLVFRRAWKAWRFDRQNAAYWGCLLSCFLYMFYGFFNVISQGATVSLFLYITAATGQKSKISTEPARVRLAQKKPPPRKPDGMVDAPSDDSEEIN